MLKMVEAYEDKGFGTQSYSDESACSIPHDGKTLNKGSFNGVPPGAVNFSIASRKEPRGANNQENCTFSGSVPLRNNFLLSGPPLVFGTGLSESSSALLRICIDRKWIQPLNGNSIEDAHDFSRCRVLVVETLMRKSGLKLCRRTLTYMNFLTMGCWIVDSRWLSDSIKANALVFPHKDSFGAEEVGVYLSPHEMGGTMIDVIPNAPRKSRLRTRDTFNCTSLLAGYGFVLLEDIESNSTSSVASNTNTFMLSSADVHVLIYRCGGTVLPPHGEVKRGLLYVTSTVASKEEDENTCHHNVLRGSDEDDAPRGRLCILAIDLRLPKSLRSIQEKQGSKSSSALFPPSFFSREVFAIVSVEWLFDAICNQRPSRDFKHFSF